MRGVLGLLLVVSGFTLAGLLLTGNLHLPGFNNGSDPGVPDSSGGKGDPGGVPDPKQKPKTNTPGSTSGGKQ